MKVCIVNYGDKHLLSTTGIFVLAILAVASAVSAHSQPLPRVSLQVKINDKAMTYIANIPTFAMEPLAGATMDTPVSELEKHEKKIADIIDKTCPVEIDGIRVRPVVTMITIFDPVSYSSFADLGYRPLAKPWTDAYIGLSYGLKGKPGEISMTWNLFPQAPAMDAGIVEIEIDDLNEVIGSFNAFEEEKYISFVPEEPVYVWYDEDCHERVKPITEVAREPAEPVVLPTVSIFAAMILPVLLLLLKLTRWSRGVLFGAMFAAATVGVIGKDLWLVEITPFWRSRWKVPGENEAKRIFTTLHRNIYRAFDYETEDDVYDALARSVSGRMLNKIYNDVYHGSIINEAGKICQIDRVDIISSSMAGNREYTEDDIPRFLMSCTWRVTGLVTHWGHVHRRVNEYSAVYTLKAVNNTWKIMEVEMNRHRRILGKNSGS